MPMPVRATYEDGFSLVEVLVTILIGMIVMAAALTFMTNAFSSSAKVQDREESAIRSRVTLDRAVAVLQAQVCNGTQQPIRIASPTRIALTANTGQVGTLPKGYVLEYQDNGGADGSGQLIEQEFTLGALQGDGSRSWDPDSTPTATRVVSDFLAPRGPGEPVFKFFGWAGVADDSAADEYSELVPGGAGTLSAEQVKKVLRVDILLRSFPSRTDNRDDRTSALIDASAYVTSSIDQTQLGDGPQCG